MIVYGLFFLLGLMPKAAVHFSDSGISIAQYLPNRAVAYFTFTEAFTGMKKQREIFENAGLSDLSKAYAETMSIDYFADPEETHLQRNGLFHLLPQTSARELNSYFRCFYDWGRGATPADTSNLLDALNKVEVAIYAGGEGIQVLQGDLAAWQAMAKGRGQWEQIDREGSIVLELLEEAEHSWYVAQVGDVLLRATNFELLRSCVKRIANRSHTEGLSEDALFQRMRKQVAQDKEFFGYFDMALLYQDIKNIFDLSQVAKMVNDFFFQGVQGIILFAQDSGGEEELHMIYVAQPKTLVEALFAAQPLAKDFFTGFSETHVYGLAFHLSLPEILQALFAPEKDSLSNNLFGVQNVVPTFFANFDKEQTYLLIDEQDRPILLLGTKDGALLRSQLGLFMPMLSRLPQLQAKEQAAGEGYELYPFSFGADQQNTIVFARVGQFLVCAQEIQSIKKLTKELTAQKWHGSAQYSMCELAPVWELFTGDMVAAGKLDAAQKFDAVIGTIDLAMREDPWQRLQADWQKLLEQRPKFHEKLQAELQQIFPIQGQHAQTDYWITPPEVGLGMFYHANQLSMVLNFFDLSALANETSSADQQTGNPIEEMTKFVIAERNKPAALPVISKANNLTTAVHLDYRPLLDTFARQAGYIQGFLHKASRQWPWYSLSTHIAVDVFRLEQDIKFVLASSAKSAVDVWLSYYLDNYSPAEDELEVMRICLAMDTAQRIFVASQSSDENANDKGEYGDLKQLADLIDNEVFLANFGNTNQFAMHAYKFSLLLPNSTQAKETRWCLFALPEKVDRQHRLAFYMDERGVLFAGFPAINELLESLQDSPEELQKVLATKVSQFEAAVEGIKGVLGSGEAGMSEVLGILPTADIIKQLFDGPEPPEHKEVYTHFLPLMTLYGTRLAPH